MSTRRRGNFQKNVLIHREQASRDPRSGPKTPIETRNSVWYNGQRTPGHGAGLTKGRREPGSDGRARLFARKAREVIGKALFRGGFGGRRKLFLSGQRMSPG